MFGFRFTQPAHKARLKAQERLQALRWSEVMDWADVAMSDAWRALEAYRREPAEEHLEDVEMGLQQVLGAIDAIRERS